MQIKKKKGNASGLKLSLNSKQGGEIGRAYVYFLKNDLHEKPFGLLEDVFVEKEYRNRGLGTLIIKTAIEEASRKKCYKLIATSRRLRTEVHKLYRKIGFKSYGLEFRMDLKK